MRDRALLMRGLALASRGLACGWEGAAWILLERERRGGASDERLHRWIVDRVGRRLRAPLARRTSWVHGEAGLLVICLIGRRLRPRTYEALARAACARLLAATERSREHDFALGTAGALWALLGAEALVPPRALRERHADVVAATRRMLRGARSYVGLAHGIAGQLLVLEAARARTTMRGGAEERARCLDRLYATPRIDGGTVWWPIRGDSPRLMNGWCHGNAGVALAGHLAWRLSKNDDYVSIVEHAMRTLAHPVLPRSLCCGALGRAHVALTLRSHPRWRGAMERALTSISAQAPGAGDASADATLWYGSLGGVLLADRMKSPDAPFPGMDLG